MLGWLASGSSRYPMAGLANLGLSSARCGAALSGGLVLGSAIGDVRTGEVRRAIPWFGQSEACFGSVPFGSMGLGSEWYGSS
jgi:hypothetical protein